MKTISQIVAGGGWRGTRRDRIKVKAWIMLLLAMVFGGLSILSIGSVLFYACIPAAISLAASVVLFIREKPVEIESLTGWVGTDPGKLYGRSGGCNKTTSKRHTEQETSASDGDKSANGCGMPAGWHSGWLIRVLAGVLLIFVFYFLSHHWDQARFEEWKSEVNPVVFFSMLAVLPLFFVPVTPFFVVAGAVFPTWVAITGCASGVAVNCLLNYKLAHMGWLRWMKRWISRFEDRRLGENPNRVIHVAVLIKITPGLPSLVKNTILALSGIRFHWYFALSWGFSMVYAMVLVMLGDSIVDADFSRMIPAVVALALLGAAVVVVRRRLQARPDLPGSGS